MVAEDVELARQDVGLLGRLGYLVIRNRPIGTPRLIALATVGSNVPLAIDLSASIGGVSVKSEIDRTFPMTIPIAMLTTTKTGGSRKSPSRASNPRAFTVRRPADS